MNKNNRKTLKTASTKGGDAAVTLITEICKLLPFSREFHPPVQRILVHSQAAWK